MNRADVLGSGDTIVFAHGMLMDRRMFRPQLDVLSKNFRTVAYDSRARGATAPYDLYDLADDLARTLDELGVDTCVLAGMSMGGWMAIRATLRNPERIAGLILMGASTRPYTAAEQGEWMAYYARVRGEQRLPAQFAYEQAADHFSPRSRRNKPELVSTWSDRMRERSGEETFQEVRAWATQDDIRASWSTMKTPVLIIHGDEDTAVPLERGLEAHATAQNSRLLVVPYAGHAVNLEHPQVVNSAISAFTQEVSGR